MTEDQKKVLNALIPAIKHYKTNGGRCLMCKKATKECVITAHYNHVDDIMGPFSVVPLCTRCKAINTDGSTEPLRKKVEEAGRMGKAKVI